MISTRVSLLHDSTPHTDNTKFKVLVGKFVPIFSRFLDLYLKDYQDKTTKVSPTYLEKYLLNIINVAYNFGGQTAFSLVGFPNKKFLLENEDVKKFLESAAKEAAIFIYQNTKKQVLWRKRDPLSLKMYLERSKKWRALLIVTREFQFGFSLARFHVFKKSGVLQKKWVVTKDSVTRESHIRYANLGWVKIDFKYGNKFVSPGIDDADSFGCRCYLLPDNLGVEERNLWQGE